MTWEAIIDQMKEWVIAQAYATIAYVDAEIAALKAWVQAQGYFTKGYIDRGVAPGVDYNLAQFTANDAWHTLHITELPDDGMQLVECYLHIKNAFVGKKILFRKKGYTNANNVNATGTIVANVGMFQSIRIAVNTEGECEYFINAGGWAAINLTVRGWWY